ncbi:MAG: peptidyl-prolyl isomerase [Parcubacteria group bacterium Gr01-1014_30]|nr:MAG: peptidyl-prolyl isomerase [Parcubacteria group bacterium Gr01-1014_30]
MVGIRKALQKDRKNILKIIGALRLDVPGFIWADEEFVKSQIKKGEYFVAEDRNQVVGVISLRKKADNIMYIETLAVAEKFRGRGIGTKLVEFAKSAAKEQKVQALRAYAFYEYETGDFYKKLGFSLLKKRGVYSNRKFYRLEYTEQKNDPSAGALTELSRMSSGWLANFWRKPAIASFAIVALASVVAAFIIFGSPVLPFASQKAVAVVNGEKITKDVFDSRLERMLQTEPAQVNTVQARQVLDLMINEVLLFQDANQRGVAADEAEVENQFGQILAQFPTEEEFEQALSQEETSRQELKKEIEKMVIFDKYFGILIQERSIVAEEQEVKDFYEGLPAQETQELTEVREQIEQSIISQKLQVELQEVIAELRAKAKIEIFI